MQPLIVVERRRQDSKLGVSPAFALLDIGRGRRESLEQGAGAVGEATVYDVDVADGAATHHEGETDVPVGLGPGAVHGDGADVGAPVQETGRGEGRAEGRQSAGVDDTGETSFWREEVHYAGGWDGFHVGIRGDIRGRERHHFEHANGMSV